jgi:hypothetical protein
MTEGTFPLYSMAIKIASGQLPLPAGRSCTFAARGAGNIVDLSRYRSTSSYLHVFTYVGAKSEVVVLFTTKPAGGERRSGSPREAEQKGIGSSCFHYCVGIYIFFRWIPSGSPGSGRSAGFPALLSVPTAQRDSPILIQHPRLSMIETPRSTD